MHDGKTHRKIVQMVGAHGPATGANIAQAYALCDDGTVWRLEKDTSFDVMEWKQIDVAAVEKAALDPRR
jgi:hypothetical protein